jgi:hypothetical protein
MKRAVKQMLQMLETLIEGRGTKRTDTRHRHQVCGGRSGA